MAKYDSQEGREIIISLIESRIPHIKTMLSTKYKWQEVCKEIMEIDFDD